MSNRLRDQVAITGVGYSDLSRRPSASLGTLTVSAVDAALDAAGLRRSDVDGIATSPSMPRYGGRKGVEDGTDIVSTGYLAGRLGIADAITWSSSTTHMVTYSLIDAVHAIAAGACETVVVYRAVHVPDGRYISFDSTVAVGGDQFTAPFGFSGPPSWAGVVMRRYLDLHGYSREHLARFAVANRATTLLNPRAYWSGKPLTVEDYLGARMVSDPMTILDCDIPVDGAVALVLTSAERAASSGAPHALVSGYALGTQAAPRGVYMTLEDLWSGTERMGVRLWQSSGMRPEDIDVVQAYDGFSIFVPTWLEGLGFHARGDALGALAEGSGSLTGPRPVNTGGGSLGEGRLHGMTQLAEAVLQLTDQGGQRQVDGAGTAVATISNGLAGSTAFALRRP